jgi:hypothetical protein
MALKSAAAMTAFASGRCPGSPLLLSEKRRSFVGLSGYVATKLVVAFPLEFGGSPWMTSGCCRFRFCLRIEWFYPTKHRPPSRRGKLLFFQPRNSRKRREPRRNRRQTLLAHRLLAYSGPRDSNAPRRGSRFLLTFCRLTKSKAPGGARPAGLEVKA